MVVKPFRNAKFICTYIMVLLTLPAALASQPPDEELCFLELNSRFPKPVDKFSSFKIVNQLMDCGRYEKAIQLLRMDSYKRDDATSFKMIQCEFLNGNFDSVISHCEQWLKDNSKRNIEMSGLAWELIASANFRKGNYSSARANFEKADLMTHSESAKAGILEVESKTSTNRNTCTQKVDFSKSLNEQFDLFLGQSRALTPTAEEGFKNASSEKAHLDEAVQLSNCGKFADAYNIYKNLALHHTGVQEYWMMAGVEASTAAISKRIDERSKFQKLAIETVQKAISLNADDWRNWNNLGNLHYASNDGKAAHKAFMHLLEMKNVPSATRKKAIAALGFCVALSSIQKKL